MTKKRILSKLEKNGFSTFLFKGKYLLKKNGKTCGAIKFYDDFPHILFDNRDELLYNTFNDWGIEQKPIEFNDNELF